MGRNGIRSRWLAGALAATLAGSSGCLNCLHPVAPLSQDVVAQAQALPTICRNRVYVFLINGNDPVHAANLDGVRQALIDAGYPKIYCAEYIFSDYCKKEILRLHREDESARFVVLGFSVGARTARDLVESLRPDGVTVDLLMYCGPVTIPNDPSCHPANALHVVSVYGQGLDWICGSLDGADNIHYPSTYHFGTPTNPQTIETLARELTEVASRVRVTDLGPSAGSAAEVGPTPRPADGPAPEVGPPPRPAQTREALPHDDWDFLKPTSPTVHDDAKDLEPARMPKAP